MFPFLSPLNSRKLYPLLAAFIALSMVLSACGDGGDGDAGDGDSAEEVQEGEDEDDSEGEESD